jgi:hypothetical protein
MDDGISDDAEPSLSSRYLATSELGRDVEQLRKRCEAILKKILALPGPVFRVERKKKSRNQVKSKKTFKCPRKICPKKNIPDIPDPPPPVDRLAERYEHMCNEIERLKSENALLSREMKQVTKKLRDSKRERMLLREALEKSQKHYWYSIRSAPSFPAN